MFCSTQDLISQSLPILNNPVSFHSDKDLGRFENPGTLVALLTLMKYDHSLLNRNGRSVSMKHRSFRQAGFSALVLFAFAALIVAGCSKSPMSSDTVTGQPAMLHRAASATAAMSPGAEFYVEKQIVAADGGSLQLADVTLSIPSGALAFDTLYSISIPDINTFYNEFGTNGLVFDKPVTVTMSYRDADLSGVNVASIRIAWLNPKTGMFESIRCTLDPVNKTVTGTLNHFSAYALISD
jgi:hypothetical protein